MATTSDTPVWSPAELYHRLDQGQRFTLLDVRNRDEFEAWQIEGKAPIPTVNIPYFDLLDLGDEDEDIAAAVARAVPERLQDKLPKTGTILAVCAKGDTSTFVAEGLRRLGYQAVNLAGGMAAWGDHYEVHSVEDSARLTLLQVSRPARGCLSYLVASAGEAMVVDAGRHTRVYSRIAAERGWRITAVLDTHLQADHLSGGRALAQQLGVDYWLHPYDSIHPDDLLPATFRFRYLKDNATFKLGKVEIQAMHLPGHTLGMVNPLVDGRFVLTSDTLFINSVGRPDLGGRATTWTPLLYRSLQRLLTLPGHSVVLPAHFSHMNEADGLGCYGAAIGDLRHHNEGLHELGQGLAAFTAYILAHLPQHPASYDDIRRVNTGLMEVDEIKASELELGRNQCALAHSGARQRKAA